jgi:hypothetical protein
MSAVPGVIAPETADIALTLHAIRRSPAAGTWRHSTSHGESLSALATQPEPIRPALPDATRSPATASNGQACCRTAADVTSG